MKIYFERSGGITGIKENVLLDTESLSPQESEEIQYLLNNVHFFDLPSKYQSSKQGADIHQYKITVEKPQAKHTVDITGFPLPSELIPLIEYLSSKIRKAYNN